MIDNVIIPIIFGAVQGLTEFLPISSSGHLVILHNLFDSKSLDSVAFDVFLHLATLFAAVVFFFSDIKSLFRAVIFGRKKDQESRRIAWYILLASAPAALAGFFLEDIIENFFRNTLVVIVMLVFVAVLFLLVEKLSKIKIDSYKKLNWKESLLVGLSQALALIPGTSRSGITTITGMWLGLKREEAIRFSFLLSIPIIAGASLVKLPDLFTAESIQQVPFLSLLLAFFSAFSVGFLAIKYLLSFAKENKLNVFAYYRIALALVLLLNLIFS